MRVFVSQDQQHCIGRRELGCYYYYTTGTYSDVYRWMDGWEGGAGKVKRDKNRKGVD